MTDWYARQLWEERRRQRRADRAREIAMQVNKLSADRVEIEQEYRRVSEVYVRHLQRLKAKIDKHNVDMRSLAESAKKLAA